jgi:N-acetylmuramoyl-L-alanine amidase
MQLERKGKRSGVDWRLILAVILLLLILFAMLFMRISKTEPKTLDGLLLVSDPGHGGLDAGAWCVLNGDTITENETANDVALRVNRMASEEGAVVISTTWNGGEEENSIPSPIREKREEKFTLDSSLVTPDSLGLLKRVKMAEHAVKLFPTKHPIFVAYHYDWIRPILSGVRIIYPVADRNAPFVPPDSLLVAADSAFGKYGMLMRVDKPLVPNRSDILDYENLRVLRSSNPVNDRIIIELGNTQNPGDCEGMANPVRREELATVIVQILKNRMKMGDLYKAPAN